MSSLRLLLLLVVWMTVVVGEPLRAPNQRDGRSLRPRQNFLAEASIGNVLLSNSVRNARLIATKPIIPALHNRLPDNYTLILEEPLVDTFSCEGRKYGYYGDVDNNCQIFHVCVPLKQLYPNSFAKDITYHFSFICNEGTIFTQDAMVCAWKEEAIPCEETPKLYWMNQNFFRKVPKEDGTGERYAHVNEKLS